MTTLQGRGMVSGKARGPALVTRQPMNFTAAFTKPINIILRPSIQDRHHDLYRKSVKDKVLVFPACIGSTYTGMVLTQLMHDGHAPAAMVVQSADPLLVSGSVLAEVWFQRGIPVVEYDGEDLSEKIRNGDQVEVDGNTGEIKVY